MVAGRGAPHVCTMQQAAAAAGPAAGADVAYTCIDEQPHSAKYTVREVDAASFMGPAGQLHGAPMKVTSSYILDHTIRRTEAHIEVLPPRDLPLVPGKSKKMRRVNDRKTLTALGIAALGRSGRGSRGQLGASTAVATLDSAMPLSAPRFKRALAADSRLPLGRTASASCGPPVGWPARRELSMEGASQPGGPCLR